MPAPDPSSPEVQTLLVQKFFVEHFAIERGFVLADQRTMGRYEENSAVLLLLNP